MAVFSIVKSDFSSPLFQFLVMLQTGPGTSLCSCSGLSLPSRPHSLFLVTIPKQDQESLSAPSLPIQSLQGWGLFLVSWHNADTGLLHLILVLQITVLVGPTWDNLVDPPLSQTHLEQFRGVLRSVF